jgi:acyl-[acyl-carrier-protein] desaturase
MKMSAKRIEVMKTIEGSMEDLLKEYLRPINENWQPSDFLPSAKDAGFSQQVKELQEVAGEMDTDLLNVLIGDTITEEALPTYESWLMNVDGVDAGDREGWAKWVRGWTAEETRHGDLLSKYIYLTGRVNMRQVEVSTQHLINDGFDIMTGTDPYRNFVYTSFQETATNISHRRVASLAQKAGNRRLAEICGIIAADEKRHARAYMNFSRRIFVLDPSEMMLAFQDMMKRKIVMPAHYLRETGGPISGIFAPFADAAQRIGVYTTKDYIDILKTLLRIWEIDKITGLNDEGAQARDFLMALPKRLERIASRVKVSEDRFAFKWDAQVEVAA